MLFHRLEEKCLNIATKMFCKFKSLKYSYSHVFSCFFFNYYLSSLGNNYVLNRENNAFSLCAPGEGQQNATDAFRINYIAFEISS